jgi:hypothetical protein
MGMTDLENEAGPHKGCIVDSSQGLARSSNISDLGHRYVASLGLSFLCGFPCTNAPFVCEMKMAVKIYLQELL